MSSKWIMLFFGVILFASGCGPVTPMPVANPNQQVGDRLFSQVDGAVLVSVPAGEFVMGSVHGMVDEQPAHKVYLDSFWLDQTEVTNEAYRRCVGAEACGLPSVTEEYDDPDYASHPVEYVSWKQAAAYCSWAGRRLPTEAEWEKAAAWDPAANGKLEYPWGNVFDCSKGNFDDETSLDASLIQPGAAGCDGFPRSAPVGSFPQGASPYGALDMAGNVWEWVHDAFLETDPLLFSEFQNYYAISPYANPQGVDPAASDYRVMRGGSWNWTFGVGRSAYRLWYGLNEQHEGVGFRCAQN
jgi:formylglycine-generating enzyme required for sulfatase activity